jgi:hypothetical protein
LNFIEAYAIRIITVWTCIGYEIPKGKSSFLCTGNTADC